MRSSWRQVAGWSWQPVERRSTDRLQARPTTRRSWRWRKLSRPAGSRSWARWGLFATLGAGIGPGGLLGDVTGRRCLLPPDGFQLQRGRGKGEADAVTLENEAKVLATTGDFSKLKRTQRRLSRVKAWEEKCDKEAKRFEKAAEWTEAHFHLKKPKIPDKPPGPMLWKTPRSCRRREPRPLERDH